MERKYKIPLIIFLSFIIILGIYFISHNQKIKVVNLEGNLFLEKGGVLKNINEVSTLNLNKNDKIIAGENFMGYLILNGLKVIKFGPSQTFNIEKDMSLSFGSIYSFFIKILTSVKESIGTSKGVIFLSSSFFDRTSNFKFNFEGLSEKEILAQLLKEETDIKIKEKLKNYVISFGLNFTSLNLTKEEMREIKKSKIALKTKQEELLKDSFVSQRNNIESVKRELNIGNSQVEDYINLIILDEIDIENELIGKEDEFPKRILFLVKNIKLLNEDLDNINNIIQ